MPKVDDFELQYMTGKEGRRHFILIQPNSLHLDGYDLTSQEFFGDLEKYSFLHPVSYYRRLLSK